MAKQIKDAGREVCSALDRLRTPICAATCAGIGFFALTPALSSADVGCPNEAIREEQGSTYLPDCRAYERISPATRYGQPVFVSTVASDGERVIASSIGSFAGSTQVSPLNVYEFIRGAGGWETVPLNTPAGYSNPQPEDVVAESPDLRRGLFDYLPSVGDPRAHTYYLRDLPEGPPLEVGPLFSSASLVTNPVTLRPNTSSPSTSKDLSHMLFELEGPTLVRGPLVDYTWPDDETTVSNDQGHITLYEYTGTGNSAPSLVGVDDEGNQISRCGTSLGYPGGSVFSSLQAEDAYNAISADGSHVFFTAAAGTCAGGSGPPADELFARIDNGEPGAHTVAISEPTKEDCEQCNTSSPAAAIFQGASQDGSKAFFLTSQSLLGEDSTQNLYEYDSGGPAGLRLTRVSAGDPTAANVQGVARVSEDGSHVYFVAQGVLTAGANAEGNEPTATEDNLYVYNTTTQQTHFIATLLPSDSADWRGEDNRPVDATPDGRFLVFTSAAQLTPEDASAQRQIFLYDAQTQTLALVSRPQEGFSPSGGDFAASIAFPQYVGSSNPAPRPGSISDDGSHVVFQTEADLTPGAAVGYNNVYSYHEGQVSLISDGQDHSFLNGGLPTTSLIGIDPSGADVFLTSADRLAPQDGDTMEDVYDARTGGGFPAQAQSPCSGDACHGPSTTPPIEGPSGSAGFSGPGNPEPLHKKGKHHKRHHVRHERNKGKHKHRVKKHQRKGTVNP